jgi:tetratricopeptide (TPR) repeat protein
MFNSQSQIEKKIRIAERLYNQNKLSEAKDIFLKVLKVNSKNIFILEKLADICIQLQCYDEACVYFSRLERLDENNVIHLTNFSFSLDKIGQYNLALQVLDRAKQLDPDEISIYLNQTVTLCNLKRYTEAQASALIALKLQPYSALALNNLGAVFQKLGDRESAKASFETAIALDNNYLDPRINLAGIYSNYFDFEKTRVEFEKILSDFPNIDKITSNIIKAKMAYEYLRIGDLNKGWEYYELASNKEIPFETSRNPKRTFSKPKWNGENLNGKTLLVWAEQGLGDEITFGTCITDLKKICAEVIIECDIRLVEPFKRSFPTFIVRASAYNKDHTLSSIFNDYDYHIPFGSLMKFFRKKIDDFSKSSPYIIINKIKAQDFENRIKDSSFNKIRIGFSWRSGLLHAERNTAYTSIKDWGPIFSLPNIELVNLQYDNCEDELCYAENEFNIRILRWKDLDLKNDIDDTLALISRLDLVITVANVVSSMAPAIGVPTLLLSQKMAWDQFGTENSPFFPLITPFPPKDTNIQAESLNEIALFVSTKFTLL